MHAPDDDIRRLVSTVSHELRAPLCTIREGIAQVADEIHGSVTNNQKSVLDTTLKEIDRLGRYINDLLDMERISEGADDLYWEDVSSTALIADVVTAFGPEIIRKGLTVEQRCPPAPVELYADRDKLHRVLTNIIGNALKYTDVGTISVRVSDDGDRVRFSIADTGTGISNEDLPHVFQRFSRFTPTEEPSGHGTGLGLSICREIVERHGGRISAESTAGKGSVFFFELPKRSVKDVFSATLYRHVGDGHGGNGSDVASVIIFTVNGESPPGPRHGAGRAGFTTRDVAELIRTNLRRRGDTAFEDGERVLTILPSTAKGNALIVAGRIRQLSLERSEVDTAWSGITLSHSVINVPGDVPSADDVVSAVF